MSLTPKREKFVQAYVETGNASEAYRRAFKADKMSDAAIAVEASRLLDDRAHFVHLLRNPSSRKRETMSSTASASASARTPLHAVTGSYPGSPSLLPVMNDRR